MNILKQGGIMVLGCMMAATMLTNPVMAATDVTATSTSMSQNILENQLRATLIALIQQLQTQIQEILTERQGGERGQVVVATEPVMEESEVSISFEDEEGDNFVSIYDVVDGTLRERSGDVGASLDQDTWELLVDIAGSGFIRDNVVEFLAFDDGDNDTDAYVQASDQGNGDWRFAYNRAVMGDSANQLEVLQIVVHEFSHILSLNDDQLDGDIDEEDCQTWYQEEGCPEDDSYFWLFVDEFWSENHIEYVMDEYDGEENGYELYEENMQDFVSEYAASNPGEDFAETFAFFVTEDRDVNRDAKRHGSEKIGWMYDQSELVEWRNGIRERVGLSI